MTYYFKDNYYKIHSNAELKIGSQWLPAVIYYRTDEPGNLYVREEGEFYEKFTVKDEPKKV